MINDPIFLNSNSVLQKALNIQLESAKLGFDWPEVAPVFDKVLEEIEEVRVEVYADKQQQQKIEDEIGDLLFAVVNLSRHLDVNPEIALEKASEKFTRRFMLVEEFAIAQDVELTSLNIDALELLWQKAKVVLSKAEQ
ncbi:MAG: ATP diphosphatase [Gammaproteobacteria bacterium]|jgi:ATP diphosphatase|tara:strand:+ start:72 stop:485 length:414 start_codon:yes stop_codon:yes gene_type:complete